jgi:hypothetical protein
MLSLRVVVVLLLFVGSVSAQSPPARSEAEKKAIGQIRQLGGLALELAQNDPRLEVSFQQIIGKIRPEHLALLKELKDVVYLNLRGLEDQDH